MLWAKIYVESTLSVTLRKSLPYVSCWETALLIIQDLPATLIDHNTLPDVRSSFYYLSIASLAFLFLDVSPVIGYVA